MENFTLEVGGSCIFFKSPMVGLYVKGSSFINGQSIFESSIELDATPIGRTLLGGGLWYPKAI